MNKSFDNRLNPKKKKIINDKDFQNFDTQEKIFAEREFHRIYSQEMSKLLTQISHQKKIKQNLESIDSMENKLKKQQQERLENKLVQFDKHRQENMNKKIKNCKAQDEKWKKKMEEIQRNFKSKNRQALQKANIYRQESEKYMQFKKNKNSTSRSQISLNETVSRHSDTNNAQYKMYYFPKVQKSLKRQESKTHYSPTKSIIDIQIQKHQNKVSHLQNLKENQNFQKALQKLQKIEISRKNKKKQSKPNEATVVRKINNYHSEKQSHLRSKTKVLIDTQKKVYRQTLDDVIKMHLAAKQKKEIQDFEKRGEIFQNSIKKNKKMKIIELIKGKVQTMKMNAIRQALQA